MLKGRDAEVMSDAAALSGGYGTKPAAPSPVTKRIATMGAHGISYCAGWQRAILFTKPDSGRITLGNGWYGAALLLSRSGRALLCYVATAMIATPKTNIKVVRMPARYGQRGHKTDGINGLLSAAGQFRRGILNTIWSWGARIRTWEWRIQSPLPYHLATPQWFRFAPSIRWLLRHQTKERAGARRPVL
jgi:hypothetical protein